MILTWFFLNPQYKEPANIRYSSVNVEQTRDPKYKHNYTHMPRTSPTDHDARFTSIVPATVNDSFHRKWLVLSYWCLSIQVSCTTSQNIISEWKILAFLRFLVRRWVAKVKTTTNVSINMISYEKMQVDYTSQARLIDCELVIYLSLYLPV